MGKSLHLDSSTLNFAVSIMAMVCGMFIVVIGRLGDILGHTRVLRIGYYLSIVGSIILQVGDGTREVAPNETLNGPQYEDIEVEKKAPEYDEVYEYVEVPVDENGNEIKTEQNNTVPSIPPSSKEAVPSEKPAEE